MAGIAASGARVIGDLESLTVVPRSRLDGDRLPEVQVSPEIAAWMAMGAVLAGNLADPRVTDAGGRARWPRSRACSSPVSSPRAPGGPSPGAFGAG